MTLGVMVLLFLFLVTFSIGLMVYLIYKDDKD